MKVKSIPNELLTASKIKPVGENIYDIPALWFEDNIITLIDQRVLPHRFELYQAKNCQDVAFVIRDMVVRGAPAIGAAAAYGIAQAACQEQALETAAETILSTRPTAYDLFFAVEQMLKAIGTGANPTAAAESYVKDIVTRCKTIGEVGNALIEDGNKILTHCNAGALATVDHGTALAPIRAAHDEGKRLFVFVDETRPRLQGARLTAWELCNEGIPHAIIADNAAGYYLSTGELDLVITGADRIASNGDAANKIGTYEKAVLAHENGVPFYIAAPISTIDLTLTSGLEIPIEERGDEEVLQINGQPISFKGAVAKNPAFDVTPHKYITGFITEFGIIEPKNLKELVTEKAREGQLKYGAGS